MKQKNDNTKSPVQIQRVQQMEALYESIYEAISSGENKAECVLEKKTEIDKLMAYYEGGDWLQDYDAEQRDLFPKDMKRGILAEDTIYDLLCEIEEQKKNIK